MALTMRPATRRDSKQMLRVYDRFTQAFVGSARRTLKNFSRMLQRKDSVIWVALNGQGQVIGYVYASFEKRRRLGEFREIIVDPAHDFGQVSKPLIEKVNEAFTDKKVCMITAGSIRNPVYEKLFRPLGFYESESVDVFMYAILNVPKFLDELSPVLVNRLEQIKGWTSVVQIECEGHCLFLQKTNKGVQRIVWTNEHVDFRLTLTREILTKLILGVADPIDAQDAKLLIVNSTSGPKNTNRLLGTLFPKRQFLVMDYW